MISKRQLRIDQPRELTTAQVIGWQERVVLPNFDSGTIIAKIDSGALVSSLHAIDIRTRWTGSAMRVSFHANHTFGWNLTYRRFSARIIDEIVVKSSHATFEKRYVIETPLRFGHVQRKIRLSLTDRSTMQFALLLGRDALPCNYLIDCGRSFLLNERPEAFQ